MYRNIFQSLIIIGLTVTSFFCAGQVAPSGGPPDTTPPEIIATFPEPRALNFHEHRFFFAFSKYVDRRSVEESIFISPAIGELTFEWGSADVEIRFTDTLRPMTTYIITLGTDVVDTRSNHMAKAFSLPFSTGNEIDTCSISGSVIDKNPAGIMIFGYQLNGRKNDTLNPSTTKPDYITQTGKDASFTLPYLAFGTYRLIAVRDEYKNLLYDVQTDQYGVSSSDVVLTPEAPIRKGIQFQMTGQDTSVPFLSSAKALDRTHILLRFNEAMDASSITADSISIYDTLTRTPLAVVQCSFADAPSLEAQLVTAPQQKGLVYRLLVIGGKDIAGNALRATQNRSDFPGSPDADTTKPVFEFTGLVDNNKDIPVEDTIRITFSEPILRGSFERGFVLFDTSMVNINGNFDWWYSTAVSFIPSVPLAFGTKYRVKIMLDSLVDFSGNRGADSSRILKFQTIDEKVLSSINGNVLDAIPGAQGRVFVTATNITNTQVKPVKILLSGPGNFMFAGLVEGRYVLSAFRDADSNGIYSFGTPFPFQTAERFTIYPDTLKLRARWPLEGASIRLTR